MATSTADNAVRDYLSHLRNPDSMKADTAAIDAQLDQTEDPLERLSLRAKRAQMEDPEPALKDAFITHAKAWAEQNNVPVDAFKAEGVRPEVLREAGLNGGRRRSRRSGATGARRGRVTTEQVKAALPAKNKTFTLRDIQNASGASAATVRKVITDLINGGYIADQGSDPDASGPGRAPTLYKVAKKVPA